MQEIRSVDTPIGVFEHAEVFPIYYGPTERGDERLLGGVLVRFGTDVQFFVNERLSDLGYLWGGKLAAVSEMLRVLGMDITQYVHSHGSERLSDWQSPCGNRFCLGERSLNWGRTAAEAAQSFFLECSFIHHASMVREMREKCRAAS
ncbi:hypothetical protein [Burkholderia ubonensis]|uniref:hypothetical protein n=1 Tax=Burkholderia ubonensis TaxID=101571 RepID=UPI0012F9AD10|nr:hypothetical protein [Burkholderia ubonensis]